MALAYDIAYGNLIFTKMLGSRSFLNKLYRITELPDAQQAGSVTVTLQSAFAAAAPVDGTMLSNDSNQVAVALTVTDMEICISLPPSAYKSNLTSPANIAIQTQGAADEFLQDMQNAVIAGLKAGTPGDTNTLTIGQVDFVTDGTAAEAHDNFMELNTMVAFVLSNNTNLLPGQFSMPVAPAAWANLVTLKATGMTSPEWFEMEGLYKYMGIPLFPIAGATSFGAAGNACLFMLSNTSYANSWKEPWIHGGGWMAASDAHYKLILNCPYTHGMILDDYQGSILNPAS
jgi:hypothetical protein